jgi:hypothetical protein
LTGIHTYERPNIFTVSFKEGPVAEYLESSNLLEAAPPTSPISPVLLPHWIQNGVNTTLFLSGMSKPHHGKLFYTPNHQWIFCPGKTCDHSKGIELVYLPANCQHLLDTGKIFRGHK